MRKSLAILFAVATWNVLGNDLVPYQVDSANNVTLPSAVASPTANFGSASASVSFTSGDTKGSNSYTHAHWIIGTNAAEHLVDQNGNYLDFTHGWFDLGFTNIGAGTFNTFWFSNGVVSVNGVALGSGGGAGSYTATVVAGEVFQAAIQGSLRYSFPNGVFSTPNIAPLFDEMRFPFNGYATNFEYSIYGTAASLGSGTNIVSAIWTNALNSTAFASSLGVTITGGAPKAYDTNDFIDSFPFTTNIYFTVSEQPTATTAVYSRNWSITLVKYP
jgi:hypothetical protein